MKQRLGHQTERTKLVRLGTGRYHVRSLSNTHDQVWSCILRVQEIGYLVDFSIPLDHSIFILSCPPFAAAACQLITRFHLPWAPKGLGAIAN